MSLPPDRPGLPVSPHHLEIPIFPLPDLVLFPGVVVSLHIFEERYRRLVADVLAGDRRFGVALLKPGWQADYEGRPPVHPLVGYGVIEASHALPDGRYQIHLRGEGKGRILSEEPGGPYRRAVVALEADAPAGPELAVWVERIAAELGARHAEAGASGGRAPEGRGIEVVHLAASELALGPGEKLELLALVDPVERARRVSARLDELRARERAFAAHRPGEGAPELN